MRDLRGMTFGELTAIEPTEKRSKQRGIIWLCRCSCGNDKEVSNTSLVSGDTTSCGHKRPGIAVGNVYGDLTAIKPTKERANRCVVWIYQCSCGKEFKARCGDVSSGHTTSCGHKFPGVIEGQIFGKLTAIGPTDRRIGNREIVWFCKCSCGKTTEVVGSSLTSGSSTSCGCNVLFDYDNFRFRSKWEAYWWIASSIKKVNAEYEAHTIRVVIEGKILRYIPDFWVVDDEEFVEIKGMERKISMEKVHQARLGGHRVRLVYRGQLEEWCGCKLSAMNKAYSLGGFSSVRSLIESSLM